MAEEIKKNRKLILQWHITHRCNLRCAHCYQETYEGFEPSLYQLTDILTQFKKLLIELDMQGHINLTGGEPFIREDFLDFLKILNQDSAFLTYGILSNGSMIDFPTAQKLKDLNVSFVQISLEGNKKIHDQIRGKGSFKKAVLALEALKKAKVRSMVSFTASKINFMEFRKAAATARKYNAFKIWADRFVPLEKDRRLDIANVLNTEQMLNFFKILKKEKKKKHLNSKLKTVVETNRSLQFIETGGKPYKCGAGNTLLALMPDGVVYPCRRLPIETGNVFKTPLTQIYFSHPTLLELRKEKEPYPACKKCSYFKNCEGGAKCMSYAMTGKIFEPDPFCPYLRK